MLGSFNREKQQREFVDMKHALEEELKREKQKREQEWEVEREQ